MSLTLMHLVDAFTSILGEDHDARWDDATLCNQAGQYLFDMHEWQWRKRPSVTITLGAGQTYADLPGDLDHIISVQAANNSGRDVFLTTSEIIAGFRASSATSVGTSFWTALEYPDQPDSQSPPRGPRLALFPAASAGDQIVVNGRNTWTTLLLPQQVANVPAKMEMLLVELVRAFARSAASPAMTFSEAVEPIEQSSMLRRLKLADAMAQGNLGQMEGGVLSRGRKRGYRGWYDPSADVAIARA